MKGTLSHELDVAVPANQIWEVYSTLQLSEIAAKCLPDLISKVDIEQGDGGIGTILRVTFPPGFPGPSYQKEKFVIIDHKMRSKDVVVVEGGFLDMGFRSYLFRLEIVERTDDSSTIKSTVEYEIDEEHAANASLASTYPLAVIAEATSKYLLERKN